MVCVSLLRFQIKISLLCLIEIIFLINLIYSLIRPSLVQVMRHFYLTQMFNCVYYCTYITGKNSPENIHLLLSKTARAPFPDCMLDSLRPFRVRVPVLTLVTNHVCQSLFFTILLSYILLALNSSQLKNKRSALSHSLVEDKARQRFQSHSFWVRYMEGCLMTLIPFFLTFNYKIH